MKRIKKQKINNKKCIEIELHDLISSADTNEEHFEDDFFSKFTSIFDRIPLPAVIIEINDGRICVVNDVWENAFGFSREDVIGKTITELGIFKYSSERDDILKYANLSEALVFEDFDFYTKSKDIVSYLISFIRLYIVNKECLLIILQNQVTQKDKLNEQIRAINQNHSLFDESFDAVIASVAGLCYYANLSFLKMFGYSSGDNLSGKLIIDLIAPDIQTEEISALQDHLAGIVIFGIYETRGIRKDGSEIYIEVKPLYVIENISYTLLVIRDITDRKRREAALNERLIESSCMSEVRYLFEQKVSADTLLQQIADILVSVIQFQDIIGSEIVFDGNRFLSGCDKMQLHNTIKSEIIISGQVKGDVFIYYSIDKKYLYPFKQDFLDGIAKELSLWLARNQAENNLIDEIERYHTLVESTHDMIWIVDPYDFGLISWNTAFSDYYRDRKNVNVKVGMTPKELQKIPEYQKLWYEFYQRAISDGIFSCEYHTVLEGMYLQLSISPLHHEGKIIGVSVFGEDISDIHNSKIQLEQSNLNLKNMLKQTINMISKMVEYRDWYTGGHQLRTQNLAVSIANSVGLSDESIEYLSMASGIHDIGKVGIATDILNKSGKLTNAEYLVLQSHVEIGYSIIKDAELPDMIATIISQHHERLDGSGYPNKIFGDQIILESRILAVADVVEAMNSHRPYRPSLGIDAALEEIINGKDTHFDPNVVDVCVDLFHNQGFEF